MQNRKRDTDVQNSLLDSVGKGEGGMFQENSIETCIPMADSFQCMTKPTIIKKKKKNQNFWVKIKAH